MNLKNCNLKYFVSTTKENCNVQNAQERYVYHCNWSNRSRVNKLVKSKKSGQESPDGNLLISEIFGNLRKYEAHFTENDVISDKS